MKTFFIDMAERAIKTFAQTLLGFVAVQGAAFADIDWATALSVSGVATLASLLTSVASYKVGDKGTCSVIKKEGK